MIPGVGMEAMFAKGLLDKVGVKADYVQIGEYKGADEQYTRTDASEELQGRAEQARRRAVRADRRRHRHEPEPLRRTTVKPMIDDTIAHRARPPRSAASSIT